MAFPQKSLVFFARMTFVVTVATVKVVPFSGTSISVQANVVDSVVHTLTAYNVVICDIRHRILPSPDVGLVSRL